MRIVARFCLLIAVCSVFELYKRFLLAFLGILLMYCASSLKSMIQRSDFGCGFLVFSCFSRVFNLLGLFLMFLLGLVILQFGFRWRGLVQFLCEIRGRLSHISDGLGSKIGFGEECGTKIVSCKCGPLKLLENSKSQNIGRRAKNDVLEIDYDDKEYCGGDLEFDVMALRRLVDIERRKASIACMELEEERMAAASAADEAMAMILRLQNEKSATEIEANQYRRVAEQKLEFNQEVIQSLQWLVRQHESEKILLEDRLMSFRQKLQQYMKDDELDEFEGAVASLEHDVDDEEVVSSLGLDSSVLTPSG